MYKSLTGTDKGVGYSARNKFPVRFENEFRPDQFAEIDYSVWRREIYQNDIEILRMRFVVERAYVDVLAIRTISELGLGCTQTCQGSTPIQMPRTNSPRLKTGIWDFPLGMKLIVEPAAWEKQAVDTIDCRMKEE